jgi:hypothetical protein
VARKACRARPGLFGDDLPGDPPWDPIPSSRAPAPAIPAGAQQGRPTRTPAPATADARRLQASAFRRIWSTLLDYRDWVSYLYVPILVPILVLLPYVAIKAYHRSHRLNQLVKSFSQGTRDLEMLAELLESDPPVWAGEQPERVHKLDPPDLKGFAILQDSRIFDLREWQPGGSGNGAENSRAYVYRRLKVVKERDEPGANEFRLHLLPTSPRTAVRFPPQELRPRLLMSDVESPGTGQGECRWEVSYDFQKVPTGEFVDIRMEELSHGEYLEHGTSSSAVAFPVQARTAELTTWILMPRRKEYQSWRITRHEVGKPEKKEPVRVVTEYLADDYTILSFKLLALDPGWIYEVRWVYKK